MAHPAHTAGFVTECISCRRPSVRKAFGDDPLSPFRHPSSPPGSWRLHPGEVVLSCTRGKRETLTGVPHTWGGVWALAGARALGSQGVGCWYVWPHGSYSILAEGSSVPQAGAAAAAALPTRTYATVRMDRAVCVLRQGAPPSPSSGPSLALPAAAAPVVHKAARLELPSQPPTRYAGARTVTPTPTPTPIPTSTPTHVLMLVWRKFHQTACTASVRVLLAPFAVDLHPALQPPPPHPQPRPCDPSQPILQPPAALLPHRCDVYAAATTTATSSSSSASAAASWVLDASPDPANPPHHLHTLLLPPHLHDWFPLLTPGQWYLMPMMPMSSHLDQPIAAAALPPPAHRTAVNSRQLTAKAVANAVLSPSSTTTRNPFEPACPALRLPCESPLLPLLAMSSAKAGDDDADGATMTVTVGAAAGAAAVTVRCGGGEAPLRKLRERVRAGEASWAGSGEGVRSVQRLLQWSGERHEPRWATVSFTGLVLGEVRSTLSLSLSLTPTLP